jgi:2-polyprenyl-6-methoxyphenol hydroxylase-like FAD-dependent oxidoreductase
VSDPEAAVVGGGIGGLTAALELQRVGFQVTVYERRAELAEVNTGFLLWSFAIKRLRSLGLGERLSEIGEPLTRLVTKSWRGNSLSVLDLGGMSRRVGASAYDVHRAKLQRLLADAVGAGAIRLRRSCTGVAADHGDAVAVFDDGEVAHPDLLLGSDGVNSVVRTHVVGEVSLHRHDVAIWRGLARIGTDAVPMGDHIRVMGPSALFGAGRLDAATVRWYAGVMRTDPRSLAENHGDQVRELFHDWAEPVATIVAATEPETLLLNDAPRASPLSRWHRGNVALLGDAAHPTLPTLAMGGGMAIEDASVLGECLSVSGSLHSALTAYEGRRRRLATRLQRASLAFGGALGVRRSVAIRARDIAFRWAAPQAKAIERLMLGGAIRDAGH